MNRIVVGTVVLLLGVLVALVPQYVFPVCPGLIETVAGKHVPMKCFWMARAELGVGFIIGLSGLVMLLSKNMGVRLGLSMGTLFAGIVVIALPVCLIGVCPSPQMACHAGTLPALIILGALTILTTLFNAVYLHRQTGKQHA